MKQANLKELLIQHSLLSEIDIHFANYICESADPAAISLWLLAAFVSYFSNQGDSAFALHTVNHKTLDEIFNLKELGEGTENATVLNSIAGIRITGLAKAELLKYNSVIGQPSELKPIIFADELFYLNRFYQYETTVTEFIKTRVNDYNDIAMLKKELNELFPDNFTPVTNNINWQKVAAIVALRSKFAVISGGPGTGKTTTVGKILTLLLKQQPDLIIKMVAPTGKAADRLNESIRNFKSQLGHGIAHEIIANLPETAETIHRFLGINSRKPRYDKYRPAPIDLLLIDEASMVSLPLFAKTFEALPKRCRVILLGDKDQLMAVENGNVLQDITDSEALKAFSPKFVKLVAELTYGQIKLDTVTTPALIDDVAVQLKYSWRFRDSIGIGELSRAVNAADEHTTVDALLSLFDRYADLSFQPIAQPEMLETFIVEFCEKHLADYKANLQDSNINRILNSLAQFRILCAVNDGAFGVNEINRQIEHKLFNNRLPNAFYHGRPILITANDYRLGLMNGDVGIIIENAQGELKAYFTDSDNRLREFNPASLGEHRTAFAISIHKSQGSEFENVFIILPDRMNKILTKELVYTAITRAKRSCTMIATPNIFYQAVIASMQRQSGLKGKLSK